MGAPTNRQPDRPTAIGRPDDRRCRGDVSTDGLALEERMSASEIVAPNDSERIREIAKEVVRLHTSGEKEKAKQLGQQLPWQYNYVYALAFYQPFMKRRAQTARSISGAFDEEDLASNAMIDAEAYLRGSWGHAVAIAEGTALADLWQHAAFRKAAATYGRRYVSDLRRTELRERRPSRTGEATPLDANAERAPRDYQFIVRAFADLARATGEGDQSIFDIEDESPLEEHDARLREAQRVDAEQAITELAEMLSLDDQLILEHLVQWHADHRNLHGFYDGLVAAFAARGQNLRADAARQRVSTVQSRIMAFLIARRSDRLRAAIASIPSRTPQTDPLTTTGRIAVTYVVEVAGQTSWDTSLTRLRTHLNKLGLDSVAPWNDASSTRRAVLEALGKVATAYRLRYGRSFWASTD